MSSTAFNVMLICDGQQLGPFALPRDDTELRQRGLEPSAFLAQELRTWADATYTVAASEPELQTVATLLLNHNRARPLVVRSKAATAEADEYQRQQNNLEQRLTKALSQIQQERLARRSEREEHERALHDTQVTLDEIQRQLQQARAENLRQRDQLAELSEARQKLAEAQSQLDLLTGERTNLLSRNERFKERLDELRNELDTAHSQRVALAQEQQQAAQVIQQLQQQLAQIGHTYMYIETLLGHALEVLHRMLIDQQLPPKTSMSQQLAKALDEYASTKTYRPF